MTYEEILELLPSELKLEGRAINLKKVLELYAKIASEGDSLSSDYGSLLDIYKATGDSLDFIGATYSIWRYDFESDEDYRNRIISENITRKTPTTIPALQEAVDSVVDGLNIYENYRIQNLGDTPNRKFAGAIGVRDGFFGYVDTTSTEEDIGYNINDALYGIPCCVYMAGTAKEAEIKTAMEIVKKLLPAGVYVLIPVVSFDTWQNIYDQFDRWDSLSEQNYIW